VKYPAVPDTWTTLNAKADSQAYANGLFLFMRSRRGTLLLLFIYFYFYSSVCPFVSPFVRLFSPVQKENLKESNEKKTNKQTVLEN